MDIAENEALACLRVLVAVARADGTVDNDERKSLAAALDSLELPGGATVDALLEENVDVDAQLAAITSEQAREQLFRSAYFMAYADGTCTKEEEALVERIAHATGTAPEQRAAIERLFAGRRGGGAAAGASAIADPDERSAKIKSHVLKYAALTAVIGAFPIPGIAIATDLAVVALQAKMVRDIAAYFGHTLDAKAASSILYSLGIGTGARLAIANLAKLVPGWGSAVGATTSFASTYALGKVVDKLFSTGAMDVFDASKMKQEFDAAKDEGKAVYADQKDTIDATKREAQGKLDALAADLKAGKITQEEFDERVSQLA